ncbi:MAG TPA: hypothetical protein VGR85_05850 [Candidatus Limnocylindria bacterium]|nr:hypothetical protein [Candidatus Limnocylindria bacterium]
MTLSPALTDPSTRVRLWAGGHKATLVERIAFAYMLPTLAVPYLRVLPLALDASMLLNQVTYVVRKRQSGLLAAADLGVVRLFVGETVCAEVERNLVARAVSGRLDAHDLFDAWRTEVSPRLRIVDTTGIQSGALDRLFARGAPSDRPTAILSVALGAQLTIADDRDLLDERYAVRFTAAVHLVAPRQAMLFDLRVHYGLVLSAESVRALATAVGQAFAQPGRTRAIAVVVGLAALGVLAILIVRDPQRAHQTMLELAGGTGRAIEELVGFRVSAGRATPQPLLPSIDAPQWLRLARVLALAPASLTVEEVASLAAAPREECAATLGTYPLFVEGPDGWQLGEW